MTKHVMQSCIIYIKNRGNTEYRCICIKYDHLKYKLTLKEVVFEGHLFCPQKFEQINLGVRCIYKSFTNTSRCLPIRLLWYVMVSLNGTRKINSVDGK